MANVHFQFIFSWFQLIVSFSCFCLMHYSIMFRETENFYVSAMERLRRRGNSETKSSVNKNMNTYLICMKRCEFS